ncbi:MAG: AAA family ATPase [Candidatus Dormibacteraeota bacterium]|nr:AAA family ATPase [Candidatus Dormibacteraeota bacterium]
MRLKTVRIERFRNFVDRQDIDIEDDVTCFVGKNESGKTTILEALHRLNPANLQETKFDLTTEYPRWRLSRDRRQEDLGKFKPVEAVFELDDRDYDAMARFLPARPPQGTLCTCAKSYDNTGFLGLVCPREQVLRAAAVAAGVSDGDTERLVQAAGRDAAATMARDAARAFRDQGDTARAKGLATFPVVLEGYGYLLGEGLAPEARAGLVRLLPRFFYFSEYELLPGERDLHLLAEKAESGSALEPEEESVLALLAYAEAKPQDFLGDNYDQRKAELQASALDLTHKVFTYWTQNSDLEVDFDTELEEVATYPGGTPVMHRILKVLMRDNRHGGIVTNFETRSAGFRWFFSFLAAFSRYQDSQRSVIVLLDEPATSLHGEAQQDFLRFIISELGRSQQVLYTTHSQYMVDPSRYEKLRAVEDTATRGNPDLGVVVRSADLSTNSETILPLQAALGYSISQHLFLGAGRNLVVEGGAEVAYLQRLSAHLEGMGLPHLDARFRVLPVGSTANMPPFVSVNGRRLDVTLLLDGDRSSHDAKRLLRLADDGKIREEEVVTVGDVTNGVPKPELEDLFSAADYLKLFNLAFEKRMEVDTLPKNSDRIVKRIAAVYGPFDRDRPAEALTQHVDEFFRDVDKETLNRFGKLFEALNSTFPAN